MLVSGDLGDRESRNSEGGRNTPVASLSKAPETIGRGRGRAAGTGAGVGAVAVTGAVVATEEAVVVCTAGSGCAGREVVGCVSAGGSKGGGGGMAKDRLSPNSVSRSVMIGNVK